LFRQVYDISVSLRLLYNSWEESGYHTWLLRLLLLVDIFLEEIAFVLEVDMIHCIICSCIACAGYVGPPKPVP
jgi:hypothetical protein